MFLHFLFAFIYSTILLAENVYPNIGQGNSANISFILLLVLINYKLVNSFEEIFLYGFLTDSLTSNYAFGFFTILFLIYMVLIRGINVSSIKQGLYLFIFLIHYLLTSVSIGSFNPITLLLSVVFYVFVKFVLLVILKR